MNTTVSSKTVSAPRGWRQDRTAWLFMTPFLLLFSVFVLIPVVASMALSFTSFDMLQTPKWVFWIITGGCFWRMMCFSLR